MNGKECRAARREIDESELNQRLSESALSHVALCAACREFRVERAGLRELIGSLEPVAAPGNFELRLRARMAAERQGRGRQASIFHVVIGAPAITAAALLVVLALSLVWFVQRNRNQEPAIASAPTSPAPATPNQSELVAKGGDSANRSGVSSPADHVRQAGRANRDSSSAREANSRSGVVSASDYSDSRAPSVRQIDQRAGEVSLSAPLKPMIVSLQDDRGATRRISLPPVSFGAQRLGDNRIPVSYSSNSRSW